jgi:predicted dehydrogenase
MSSNYDRRDFLKAGTIAGLGLAGAGAIASAAGRKTSVKGKAKMIGFKTKPKDLIKIGFVGIGNQGIGHIKNLVRIDGCQVTAVCDIRPERTEVASNLIGKYDFPAPKVYAGGDEDFVRMCQEEDLDLVYNAAPWRWHTPICLAAMKNGIHAASEVNIALTIEDCWKLVETSEKTEKHCIMMENCCYDSTEMMVLNMIRKGLFGEVMHGECGYLHDLRALKLSPTYYEGMWRLHQSVKLNGNLYPTHGIGPMAWCMDINRGDALDYLVSMSTNSIGLNLFAKEKFPDTKWGDQKFALGDINTTLIRTKKGKTIICQHDTNLPRPYSRDFLVQGTKGIMRKYPTQKIHLDGITKGHAWDEMDEYTEKYAHPVWEKTRSLVKGAGHGGMDFIEDYRLINALRNGLEPDIDVYDSVAWSAIIPLSAQSIAAGSKPIEFPDFTRGAWKKKRPLQVDLFEDV